MRRKTAQLKPQGNRASCIWRYQAWSGCIFLGWIDIEIHFGEDNVFRACVHYSLFQSCWGKGYGTAVQNAAEKILEAEKIEVCIAPYLTGRAYKFWKKRKPEWVADREPPYSDSTTCYSHKACLHLYGRKEITS